MLSFWGITFGGFVIGLSTGFGTGALISAWIVFARSHKSSAENSRPTPSPVMHILPPPMPRRP